MVLVAIFLVSGSWTNKEVYYISTELMMMPGLWTRVGQITYTFDQIQFLQAHCLVTAQGLCDNKKNLHLDNFDSKNSFYHDKRYYLNNEYCVLSIIRGELLN